MKKYIIRYITTSDDYEKEWISALSEEDAREQFLHETWNVKEIISVRED